MQTIRSVQYLRGVAALAVLAFHACEPVGRSFVVGAAGVDVFFVISGFIMWSVALRQEQTPVGFLRNRIIRIVPAYWVVTSLIVGVSLLVPGSFPRLAPELGHVLLSLLFVPHVDPQGQAYPLVVAGWTLTYEMFFYAVFAACLMLPGRVRLRVLLGVLLGLVVVGRVVRPEGPVLQVWTSPLLLEFAAGIGLAAVAGPDRLPSAWWGGAAVGLAVLAFVVGAVLPVTPDSWRLGVWGLPAVLLVGGAVTVERRGLVPVVPGALALGASSYALYLVHGLVISGVVRLHLPVSFAVFLVVCAAASVCVGWAYFRLVEGPGARLLRRVLSSPPEVAATPRAFPAA